MYNFFLNYYNMTNFIKYKDLKALVQMMIILHQIKEDIVAMVFQIMQKYLDLI